MHKLFCCSVLHKGVNNKRQLGVRWIRLFQPMLSHRFMSFWLHAVGSALEIDRLHSVCHDATAVSWGPMHLDRWCLSCLNVGACMCVCVCDEILFNQCLWPVIKYLTLSIRYESQSRWEKFKWYSSDYHIYWCSAMASVNHYRSGCKYKGAGDKCMSTANMICPLFILKSSPAVYEEVNYLW